MNIICKLLGHKWDETDPTKQECKRIYCLATRWLTFNSYKHAIGEKCVDWRIIDIDDIKVK